MPENYSSFTGFGWLGREVIVIYLPSPSLSTPSQPLVRLTLLTLRVELVLNQRWRP